MTKSKKSPAEMNNGNESKILRFFEKKIGKIGLKRTEYSALFYALLEGQQADIIGVTGSTVPPNRDG